MGHPPGNPVFQVIARIFTMFAGDPSHVAVTVNAMSALCSALTIFFLYLTIVFLAKRLLPVREDGRFGTGAAVAIFGSGVVGALAYCFSDTFWFSAVEGEVYATFIPTSTKLMVCAHSPMFKQHSGSERTNTAKHGPDYGDLINNYTEVHAWAGHSHVGFNYVYPESHRHKRVQVHTLARSTGELWTNEYLASGTPRGFTIVEVDGDEITWRFHPTKYERPDWIGKSTGYTSSRPSYPHKDWTISGGKAYMKVGGALLDESYQLHAYPRGAYGDNYVYANIFLWDENWKLPVFTPDGGEPVEMERWTAADRYDLADTEMRTHYKTYSKLLKSYSGYKTVDSDPITTLFRTKTEVDESPNSGVVSVTDRFGNTWTRPVSW